MTSLILLAALIGVLFFLPLSAISWVRASAGRLLGLVFGKARASAASRETAVSGDSESIARASGAGEVSPPPPNKPIKWGSSFFAKLGSILKNWWWLFALLIAAGLFVAIMEGWIRPLDALGKSKEAYRLEAELARAETRIQVLVNERDAEIAAIEVRAAIERANIILHAQRGRDEIRAAAPENEAPADPGVVAAFRASLDRMCYPRADGSRADTCGA